MNERQTLLLAALMHDIGKFFQRADENFLNADLSNQTRQMIDYICPADQKGNFGYYHVLWTNEFFNKTEKKLKELGINNNVFDGSETKDNVVNLAVFHHKPNTENQGIVTMADWWSAGIDRKTPTEIEETPEETIKWGKQRFKQIPLYSVFNIINKGNGQMGFPLSPLTLDSNAFFPKEIQNQSDGLNQYEYGKLWTAFLEEFEKIPTDSFNGFYESLLFLLKKYTWCIPSNTTDMANVSLYDHLKTTAAFADCLYHYKQEHPEAFQWDNNNRRLLLTEKTNPVLLVGGDISGIQKFIYNIASRKAAMSLKGRSFYLQLLIDSVIHRIISHPDIDVNVGNIVYSSGGKFYMLLPNTNKVKAAIDSLSIEFEKCLWEDHFGQLLLNLDYVSFSYHHQNGKIGIDDLQENDIGDLWKCLADKLTMKKNRKFKNTMLENFDSMFSPISVGGDVKVCAVTGIESDSIVRLENRGSAEDSVHILPIVKQQAELGAALKDADFLVTAKSTENHTYLNNRSRFKITIVGVTNYLFNHRDISAEAADFRSITSADSCHIKMINEVDFLNSNINGQKISYGFQFYGGNEQAKRNDDTLKPFEDLAGDTYLGVLRMDVDNLGKIFIEGIPKAEKSFAAYSTLSFMLDYFFSGYLNTIREKYKDYVNILYSGGDDVFAVGRWNDLIMFAKQIRMDFAKFTGRKDISISGGISIVGSKFPIAKAAQMAGDAEDAAKRFDNGAKDAFNVFGQTISWSDDEFGFVEKKKKELASLCKDYNMPKAILHKLMAFADMKNRGEIGYIWNTAYYIKRFSENKGAEVVDFCNSLKKELFEKEGLRNYDLYALAARWAELELKE